MRKILCFLGFHKWKYYDLTKNDSRLEFMWSNGTRCEYCGVSK